MRFTQSTVLFSLLAVLYTASAQFTLEETDAPYPTPDASAGGLDDPYPYPTDSDSVGVPLPTPTADESGSGGIDVPYPSETVGTGSGTGSGGSGGSGGAGGYAPVPKPSGLEFPVEACYTACTPLANLAESCNYYPVDMDIDSACICTSSAQAAFKSCFDCQIQSAPMNGDLQYYQGLMDRLSEQCTNDNAPVTLSRVVLSQSGSDSGLGSGSGSGSAATSGTAKPSAARAGPSGSSVPNSQGQASAAPKTGAAGRSATAGWTGMGIGGLLAVAAGLMSGFAF